MLSSYISSSSSSDITITGRWLGTIFRSGYSFHISKRVIGNSLGGAYIENRILFNIRNAYCKC